MTFAEHSRYRANDPDNIPVEEVLLAERDRVGSTRDYVFSLGTSYESTPETRANMLQLQRMAQLVTNPNNELSFDKRLTDAFYWGEILGYSAGDTRYGQAWPTLSYKLFNQDVRRELPSVAYEADDTGFTPYEALLEQMQAQSQEKREMLWDASEELLPEAIDLLINDWANELSDDASEQLYVIMGFRHVMVQLLAHIEDDEADRESLAAIEKTSADDEAAINPAEQAARTKLSKAFMEIIEGVELEDPRRAEADEAADREIEPPEEEVSIEGVRLQLMQSIVKYRATYMLENPDYTDTNRTQTLSLAAYLAVRVNEEFSHMKGLTRGEEAVVRGEIVYLAIDDKTGNGSYERLDAGNRLEGYVEKIIILPTPINEDAVSATERGERPGSFDVGLLLVRPSLRGSDGQYRFLEGSRECVAIMLNSQRVALSKYASS